MFKRQHSSSAILLSALFSFAGSLAFMGFARASGPSALPVSDNVQLLPHRPDVTATPLDAHDGSIHSTSDDAVQAAEAQFNIDQSELDRTIGVVRARLTVEGDEARFQQSVWVVTVDRPMRGPGLDQRVFNRLCIVISATTGKYEYAYLADPVDG